MDFRPPERFNLADYLLDDRVREGRGERPPLPLPRPAPGRPLPSAGGRAPAARSARVLARLGAPPEERVLVALPDGAEFVGALFGILKLGAVVVMINRELTGAELVRMFEYTRARHAV